MIALAGWVLWTLIQWGWKRQDFPNGGFWHDYKDEAYISFTAMCVVLLWDTQALSALDLALEYFLDREVDVPLELKPEFYMLIAPATERLYTWGGALNHKFKTKKE